MIGWMVETQGDHPVRLLLDALSDTERARYLALKTPKRRDDWLLGRWTAKRLVQDVWSKRTGDSIPLNEIIIAKEAGGAPYLPDFPELAISVSHSGGWAFCAASEEGIVGADIEEIVRHSAAFIDDYFTEDERYAVDMLPDGNDRNTCATAIWSGKEAALKALRIGLTVDTRAVWCSGVAPQADDWTPFEIRLDARALPSPRAPVLRGWRRTLDRFVLTLAADAAAVS